MSEECLEELYVFGKKYLGECSEELAAENVWIRMQNYKFLHVVVMIYATLVNTQTHTQADSFRPVVLLAQPSKLITNVGHVTDLQLNINGTYFMDISVYMLLG